MRRQEYRPRYTMSPPRVGAVLRDMAGAMGALVFFGVVIMPFAAAWGFGS